MLQKSMEKREFYFMFLNDKCAQCNITIGGPKIYTNDNMKNGTSLYNNIIDMLNNVLILSHICYKQRSSFRGLDLTFDLTWYGLVKQNMTYNGYYNIECGKKFFINWA